MYLVMHQLLTKRSKTRKSVIVLFFKHENACFHPNTLQLFDIGSRGVSESASNGDNGS